MAWEHPGKWLLKASREVQAQSINILELEVSLKYWSLDSSFGSTFYLVATLKKYYHFYLTSTITLVLQFGGNSMVASSSKRLFWATDGNRRELSSFATCLHTTTFTLLSMISQVEMISLKSGSDQCPGIRKVHLRHPSVALKRRLLKLASNHQQIVKRLFMLTSMRLVFSWQTVKVSCAFTLPLTLLLDRKPSSKMWPED